MFKARSVYRNLAPAGFMKSLAVVSLVLQSSTAFAGLSTYQTELMAEVQDETRAFFPRLRSVVKLLNSSSAEGREVGYQLLISFKENTELMKEEKNVRAVNYEINEYNNPSKKSENAPVFSFSVSDYRSVPEYKSVFEPKSPSDYKPVSEYKPVSQHPPTSVTSPSQKQQQPKEEVTKDDLIAITLSEIDQMLLEGTDYVLDDLPATLEKVRAHLLNADKVVFSWLGMSSTRIINELHALYLERDRDFFLHQTTLAIEKIVLAHKGLKDSQRIELQDYLSLIRHLVLIQHQEELNSGVSNGELESILREVEEKCEEGSYLLFP